VLETAFHGHEHHGDDFGFRVVVRREPGEHDDTGHDDRAYSVFPKLCHACLTEPGLKIQAAIVPSIGNPGDGPRKASYA
jgi:hypothetical protein